MKKKTKEKTIIKASYANFLKTKEQTKHKPFLIDQSEKSSFWVSSFFSFLGQSF